MQDNQQTTVAADPTVAQQPVKPIDTTVEPMVSTEVPVTAAVSETPAPVMNAETTTASTVGPEPVDAGVLNTPAAVSETPAPVTSVETTTEQPVVPQEQPAQ